MKSNYTSSIAGAAIFITLVGIVGKGIGFFREAVFAGYFGLSPEFDLYLVGAVIPITINTIILFIAQNILIPSYNNFKLNNAKFVESFLYSQLRLFFFFSLIIFVLLFYFAPSILKIYQPEANEKYLQISINIFLISSITIPLSSIVAICISYLQANYDFKNPAIAQLFLNIVIIFMIVVLSNTFNIYAVPIGFVIGTFFQTIYLLRKTKINLLQIFNLNYTSNSPMSNSLKSLIWIFIIETIGQFYILADRSFLHQVEVGGIASINYASNIFSLPMQIFSIALTTAIFPKLSESYSQNTNDAFYNTLDKSIRIMIIIFLSITTIFFLFGEPIVRLFFERGKFRPEDTITTYNVLKILSISIVFYSVYAVLNKVFYTTNMLLSLMVITIFGIFIKIGFNIILVNKYAQYGLAMSTSITYIYFSIVSILVLKYKKIYNPDPKLLYLIFITIINCILTYYVVDIFVTLICSKTLISDIIKVLIFILVFIYNLSIYDRHSWSYLNYLKLPK
ncbi:MAG: polysaccharide biosynthesis C-terminal domain-containing protein [Ignavibacteriales bacterium]|nr:polysaccharide biosynthesis C-terminal domain-containing protein [Ignavibacteriales bacterium]